VEFWQPSLAGSAWWLEVLLLLLVVLRWEELYASTGIYLFSMKNKLAMSLEAVIPVRSGCRGGEDVM
jgi:hypothetical protein